MFKKQIKLGMAFLDKRQTGWKDKINVEHLQMVDLRSCILGQLFGNYVDAEEILDLPMEGAVACGFLLPNGLLQKEPTSYDQLTNEWKAELRRTHKNDGHAHEARTQVDE